MKLKSETVKLLVTVWGITGVAMMAIKMAMNVRVLLRRFVLIYNIHLL